MKSKKQRNQEKRREFLKTSTLLGAGVASGAMFTTSASADVTTESSEPSGQKGYRLTQHVLDYYKSADV